jgi:hypothetical protein
LSTPDSSSITIPSEPVIFSNQSTTSVKENAVLKLWNQYKQEHSQSALIRESQQNNHSRQFAVGYYSCPLQAGNRLHHFFNSLIWSIVTNRTLLWKYYDRESCLRVGARNDKNICRVANTAEDCSQVLQRASWLPSFDEWRFAWNFTSVESLSFWSTYEKLPKHKLWHEGNERFAGMADTTGSLVVEFAPMLAQDAGILKRERKRNYLLTTNAARERARRLFERGPDYLYGLLFQECFAFQPSVAVPVTPTRNISHTSSGQHSLSSSAVGINPSNYSNNSNESITIVLHSRHSAADDDGSKIKREKLCFDKLLQSQNYTSLCQVLLLSDRPKTLIKATEYISQEYPHCLVLVAPHDTGKSFRSEHGPFAGIGFFQDLAFVANQTLRMPTAVPAFVGFKQRSSSQLVREIIVYQLHQQPRNQHEGQEASPQLDTCYLEDM